MQISGIQKTSLIDYPGMVSTVLFLSGCNLRCPYCHNPGIVRGEYGAIPFEEIYSHLVKRQGLIEGVVISGGEPTMHGGLKGLCDDLRALGFKIKMDTNGLEPDKIKDAAPDYLAVDIKTSFENYHRLNVLPDHYDLTERLRRSIGMVRDMGDNAEIRITAAPGVVDTYDIENIIPELIGVRRVFIQPFERDNEMLDPSYGSIEPYPAFVLDNWKNMFESAGVKCTIRGF